MNIHIELVKKWLADPTSVTQQELYDNRDAAYAYAYDATYVAAAADADNAKYWVKRYEELKEQGECVKTDLASYYEGKGCNCFARSQADCSCNVDWTPKEVYELRKEIESLRAQVEGMNCALKQVYSVANSEGLLPEIALSQIKMMFSIPVKEQSGWLRDSNTHVNKSKEQGE